MTDYNGDLVGTVLASGAGPNPKGVSSARKGGSDKVFIRDTLELVTAFAQNDRILLGMVAADAVLDPILSVIWFDDLGGAGLTMDVGGAGSSAGPENALVGGQDVTTAAGSCSALKSVNISDYWKPLWQLYGLSANPGGMLPVYAKIKGADPGTGTVTWQLVGQRLLAG
ncbi:hypothetical protein [Phenylobacterium sp. SCN 70-31]|uniref:hypothetical protein n=1 Tax=Phenylobacterium sp. SCN 70-31 TaxID=1660129 RepID=UPI00086F1C43|nr:hypothetical protein [Phenylobacterium sp. SCN 70-31]ODT88110.1 MAG: hypothetical protein ABS78_09470 [Phenylobacterium sp. SCN 70-31]